MEENLTKYDLLTNADADVEKLKLRLNRKIEINSGDCWIPSGYRSRSGYTRTVYKGIYFFSHNLAKFLYHGPAPDDKRVFVLHGPCHNPSCCNPEHLSYGTKADNTIVKLRDGTQRHSENHGQAKLSNSDVVKIKELLLQSKLTNLRIAGMFGIHEAVISKIACGHTWRPLRVEGDNLLRKKRFTKEEQEEIVSLLDLGNPTRDVANKSNCSIERINHYRTRK